MKIGLLKKGLVFITILLFVRAGVIPSMGVTIVEKKSNHPISNGNTLYVGGSGEGNYTSIQDAINDSSDGDIIFVYSGTYQETIIVNKAIELIGQNSLSTVIESSDIASVIWIKADDVIVKQFTIKADIQCICISSSKNNIISDNILTRYNSNFNKNQMLPDDGIDLVDSTNNTIINNSISNRTAGIGFQNSSNNIISKNTFKNCMVCIVFDWYCNYNIIKENKFIENYYWSIYITEYSNNNNHIYHNIFFNSNQNAYDYCSNTWDNDYPSGGNYWNDYMGEDADGDGIGDTPYPIPGGDNEDRYPLMIPWNNQPPDAPIITGLNSGKPNTEYDFIFSSTDPDGDDIAEYIIDWGDGSSEETISGPFASGEEVTGSHSWTSQQTFTIKAKAKDELGAESNWSDFEITIPRTRSSNLWYQWLLDRFPLLEKLLNFLK